MQTRYKNEYHNEMGNTQQEDSEDQIQQDLNAERVHLYDVIPPTDTPATVTVHNTTTTNMEEAPTEQYTYTHNKQQQMSKNDTPGHRDVESSSSDRQNQTTLDDGNQEDATNTHIYHILEQQSNEDIELKDHNPPAAYEIPVASVAVSHP